MKILPWKKIGEPEVLAKSYGRRLFLQQFENPYTKEVATYSQFGGSAFSCIVMAITENNEVLATRQYRHGADRIILELPGGNPKNSEQSPEDVAREELFEESFGYVPNEITKLNPEPLWIDPVSFAFHFHAFLGLGCKQSDKKGKLDDGEYIELVKIPVKEWVDQCMNGTITDSKSVIVTMLAMRRLSQQ